VVKTPAFLAKFLDITTCRYLAQAKNTDMNNYKKEREINHEGESHLRKAHKGYIKR
jgi:hypothetical protein